MTSRSGSRPSLVAITALLGAASFLLSGCSVQEVLRFGWPEGITPEGHDYMAPLWTWACVAALVVGVIVWGLTFWTVTFHRHKKGDTDFPRQFGYNLPLELVLTAVPFLMIAVLFYFTVVVQNRVMHKDPNPEVVVDVTAFQWNWKFGYQKVAFKDGSLSYEGADPARKAAMVSKPEGTYENGEERRGAVRGLNREDRTYLNFDKIETVGSTSEIPVLVLPSGKSVEFVLNSADVIHSFRVVDFLFTRDVMPEPKANNSDNVFQVSKILKEGSFVGRCVEMCGTYHAMMAFELRVVSPNDFKFYLDARQRGMTNAEALASIGQSPVAVKTKPFDSRRGQLAPADNK